MTAAHSTLILALLAAATIAAPGSAGAQTEAAGSTGDPVASVPHRSGRIPANGVNYYYEIHGKGQPLLLLHGGLGSIDMFGPLLPALAAQREVIAVDLHGHGRTPLGDRAIDLADIGNDLAVVLKQLGYGAVDVMGYSFGGGAAFRLAVQHPQHVRRLVIVSAGYAQSGFHPEMLPMQAAVSAAMAESMKETPMYLSYKAVAPNPDEFPRLLDRMGELMRRPYDWAEDVKELQMPVMLVFGDADMFTLEHVASFYKLLGGGLKDAGWMREHMSKNRLAILPNLTHYEVFMAPQLAATVLPFLNGETGAPKWTGQARPEN
ncbi:MAG TPA: alpha/beta hydrolase [Gemmatimonadaceae bacterium]